jgi:uncharacterized OB-fold protein
MTYLKPQTGELPIMGATELSQEFWEGCTRGELMFQRCTACGHPQFPPTAACRRCLRPDLAWEPSSGRGSLYSWTVVWRPQRQSFEVPYAPAIVDMVEGYQFLTNMINCELEELRLELEVEVSFTPHASGVSIPYFQPAPGGRS